MPHRIIIPAGKRLRLDKLWSPEDLGSAITGWWDAQDYGTITESGVVTNWADKTAGGHDLSNSAGNAPAYNASDARMNGKPSIGYTGGVNRKWLNGGAVNQLKFYAVAYYDNATFLGWDHLVGVRPTQARLSGHNSQDKFQPNQNVHVYINGDYGTNYVQSPIPTVLPLPCSIIENQWDSSQTVTTMKVIGNVSNDGWGAWSYYGAIGELITTDGTESASDIRKLEGYMAHRWGLADDLDSAHPYQDAPPAA